MVSEKSGAAHYETMKTTFITKASGEREAFSEAKLRRSLARSGTSPEHIEAIVEGVTAGLREGMTTKSIYARAFSLLRRKERPAAARYHTRMALMELGPSGHPFEKFVGELMKTQGFSTEVAVVAQGRCISHELDVVAHRGEEHVMVECKFHNHPGIRSDAKVALYVQARFEDIEKRWKAEPGHGTKLHAVWLVTNTKLTIDAAHYAECVGMHAIGWNYPTESGLQDLIEKFRLHPVTCLTTLTRFQKQELLRLKILLCKDILNNGNILKKIGLSDVQANKVLEEIHNIYASK